MVYLDTSVFLRIAFRQAQALSEKLVLDSVSSELLLAEALRTVDRLRFQVVDADRAAYLKENVFKLAEQINFIPISRQILNRVASPFSLPLATLDAIHLSTAILWREQFDKPLVFLTHDKELQRAARAEGFSTEI